MISLTGSLGRSQAVRQRVLVPRSQVRILAPQPSPLAPVTDTSLAAVVMAGGLGTRMRSALPKHLHPHPRPAHGRLGARGGAAARAVPLVVVASPESRDAVRGVAVAVQERAARHRRRGPLGARGDRRTAPEHLLVLSGDTPLLTTELLEQLLETHRRERRRGDGALFEPADVRAYGRIVRGADGTVEAIVEAVDATPEQLDATASATRRSTSSAAELLWPALDRLEPHNAQGELYLTDAVRDLVGRGERVVAHVAPDPAETEGVNTRVELAAAAAALRDRINRAHMLAGVTILDPASTWIEAGVELEPDATVHPFTVLRGTTRVAGGSRDRPARGRDRRRDRPRSGRRALLLPSPWNGARAALEGRDVRGAQEGPRSAKGRRCRTSRTSATPRSGRARTSAQARSPRTSRTSPGCRRARRRSARNVRVGVDTVFVAPVTVGDDAWTAAGSVVTDDVPDNALAGFPPAPGQQGGTRWKAERLSRRSPGSRAERHAAAELAVGRAIGADAAEAADGRRGQLAPRARGQDRRPPRRRARRRSSSRPFADGETYCRYEESVRGADMFIVQTAATPVDQNLMELLIMVNAARLASAKRITAVIPWYFYARQDKKSRPREPITAPARRRPARDRRRRPGDDDGPARGPGAGLLHDSRRPHGRGADVRAARPRPARPRRGARRRRARHRPREARRQVRGDDRRRTSSSCNKERPGHNQARGDRRDRRRRAARSP